MVEAPAGLEALFKCQAAANGIDIVRVEPVELRCTCERYPDARSSFIGVAEAPASICSSQRSSLQGTPSLQIDLSN
jgi:hypothetical protein